MEAIHVPGKPLSQMNHFDSIIGSSPAMFKVNSLISRAIKTDVIVLIVGETGTGKELVARVIHDNGAQKEEPFVPINCCAIAESLLDRELFGHKRGAFTGATEELPGLFQEAHGGTLFFDEVGGMNTGMQGKLLRALEMQEIRPVGATTSTKVDVRIIAATNRDLEVEVESGRFRADLFYRFKQFPIYLPPLRKRKEDIPILARHFLKAACNRFGRRVEGFSSEAMDALVNYQWPGNVREVTSSPTEFQSGLP